MITGMASPLGQLGAPDADPRESWNSTLASAQPTTRAVPLRMQRDCRLPTRHKGPSGPSSDFFTFAPGKVVQGQCVPLDTPVSAGMMETGAPNGDAPGPARAMKPLLGLGIVVGAVFLIMHTTRGR